MADFVPLRDGRKAWKPEIPGECNSPPIDVLIALNIVAGGTFVRKHVACPFIRQSCRLI